MPMSTPENNQTQRLREQLSTLARQTGGLIEGLPAPGPGYVLYGARTQAIVGYAAQFVNARKPQEFAAADFGGKELLDDGEELQAAAQARNMAALIYDHANQLYNAKAAGLGARLKIVVGVMNTGLVDPLRKDAPGFAVDCADLKGEVDAWNGDRQTSKITNDGFRSEITDAQAEIARLQQENERLRGALSPEAAAARVTTSLPSQAAAKGRTRRGRTTKR